MTSHWLHGNSIFKIGCHFIWPGVIAFPRTPYLAIEFPLINHITEKNKKTKKFQLLGTFFLVELFSIHTVCLCLLFSFS